MLSANFLNMLGNGDSISTHHVMNSRAMDGPSRARTVETSRHVAADAGELHGKLQRQLMLGV
jgi:hypothetical protein